MLNSGDSYQNKKDDFNEINNSVSNVGNLDIKIVPNSNKKDDKKLDRISKLFLLLIGFSYIGLTVFSLLWAIVFSGFNISENLALTLAELFTYFSVLVCLFLVCKRNKEYFINEIKDYKKYLYGLAWGAITLAAELLVSYLMGLISTENNGNQEMIEMLTLNYPTILFIVTVILGPICEELTYRVGLFGLLREKNEILGIVVSSLIFAAVHISFTDTTLIAELCAFPIYLTISFLLTYTYKRHGLAASVTAHMFINLASFIRILIYYNNL